MWGNFWRRNKRVLFVVLVIILTLAPLVALKFPISGESIYHTFASYVIHPVAGGIRSVSKGISGAWKKYIYVVGLSEKVEKLQSSNNAMRRDLMQYAEYFREQKRQEEINSRLKAIKQRSLSARIVGQELGGQSLQFVINVGTNDYVQLQDPVVHSDGVVGTIVKVFPNSAIFRSILDPNHRLDALVVRSRAKFIVEGLGGELRAKLKFLDRSEDVVVGDEITTSGIDGVFPKGFLVGNIVAVKKPLVGVLQHAKLIPSVNLNRIEEVVVLIKKQGT